MRLRYFGATISPACRYCEHGRPSSTGQMILCRRKGVVEANYSCRRFLYDPLKRVPRRLPKLPQFTKEDFEL